MRSARPAPDFTLYACVALAVLCVGVGLVVIPLRAAAGSAHRMADPQAAAPICPAVVAQARP